MTRVLVHQTSTFIFFTFLPVLHQFLYAGLIYKSPSSQKSIIQHFASSACELCHLPFTIAILFPPSVSQSISLLIYVRIYVLMYCKQKCSLYI
ncbi:hypothetical protein CW304_05335 [Bacillus sp. UFRGS-B20]|nr:hypothetical protein CW304_05335 [Bacillus sp. UFRGS-B20]